MNSLTVQISFILCCLVLLVFVSWGLSISMSYFSGWKDLVRSYRYQNEVLSQTCYLHWARMRWVSYYYCLIMGGNVQGFYLAGRSVLTAGAPKLFIPWNDIEIKRKIFLGSPVLELSFAKAPSVTLMVGQLMGSPSLENLFREIFGKPLIVEK